MMEGLNFVTDEKPKQPFDKGAIAIETKSTLLYNLLNEYRSHEVIPEYQGILFIAVLLVCQS